MVVETKTTGGGAGLYLGVIQRRIESGRYQSSDLVIDGGFLAFEKEKFESLIKSPFSGRGANAEE
jgi:hypothetical protein